MKPLGIQVFVKFSRKPVRIIMDEPEAMKKTHFVLVHGVSGGAWCWFRIKSLMEISGYEVTCLDLKSAGIDRSDPNSILSFDDYNKPLMDFLSNLPDHEQVILVGHSAGGLSVTQATHKFPEKIRLAIYVAATMLRLGFCTDQDSKDGEPDLRDYGDVYDFEFGLGADQPPTSAVIKKEFRDKLIYHNSPREDATLASMLLKPGPIFAMRSVRFAEGDEVDRVPRAYIKTMQDRVLKPEQQDAMIRRWVPSQVYVLDTDHSPFFSSPVLLFGLLVQAAASLRGG